LDGAFRLRETVNRNLSRKQKKQATQRDSESLSARSRIVIAHETFGRTLWKLSEKARRGRRRAEHVVPFCGDLAQQVSGKTFWRG